MVVSGIKNIELHGKALLMKWLWKYSNENQTLWRRVIGTKYENEDSWMTKIVTTPYGTSLWRSIRALWAEVKPKFKMKDEWHEKGNLETLFPDIYNLTMFQQRTIAKLWTPQGWNFIFRREPNDWEVMTLAEFLNMVGHFTGLQAYEDMLLVERQQ
ncbi:hypothetical protein H5410_027342 [Solanum commersonii]|uniref:Uncharacterized protein n=1 Tax=Solanum commersonii TaxID=4109 RepID=A0A9J5YZL3_SOLCO|nr:hypothetical protein H5410_027342 [Solanum commersonii]